MGDTYTINTERRFENGVQVELVLQGVFERVPLPGGGVYIVAGQGTEFGLTVDHGTNGDQTAFCAALSP